MLFGTEGLSEAIVRVLGVDPPRFRDAWVESGEDNTIVLVVYTRTGGGNRECFSDDGDCGGCYHTANSKMAESPYYISDQDSDYDTTYAEFRFRCPPEFELVARSYLDKNGPALNPGEKWAMALEAIRSSKPPTGPNTGLT